MSEIQAGTDHVVKLREQLAAVVGDDHLLVDESSLQFYSTDV